MVKVQNSYKIKQCKLLKNLKLRESKSKSSTVILILHTLDMFNLIKDIIFHTIFKEFSNFILKIFFFININVCVLLNLIFNFLRVI